MSNNLYDFYTGQGKAFPSVQERAPIYEQQGLGTASSYVGSAAQNVALLGKLQTPIQPFSAPVPSNITTKDAAASITNTQELPSEIQQGVANATADPNKQLAASGVLSDMTTSNTSTFQGRLNTSANIQSLTAESSATMAALRDILTQPSPILDETQTKEQQKALDTAQKAYTEQLKSLNDEELRIKGNWGVGPIWRGRLALFNSEKALMLEPLQVQVEFLSGQYDKAFERAQQMFSNAVSLQENKISKLSALNTMISGQLSQEEDNLWKQYQIDEENRLATLKREQDLQDQKVELTMKGYVFDPTSTMDEIMKQVSPQAQQQLSLATQQKQAGLALTKAQTAKAIADANNIGDGKDDKALSELADDINTEVESGKYKKVAPNNREEYINSLAFDYPELTKEQIASVVYGLITDQKEADIRGYKLSSGAATAKKGIKINTNISIPDELTNYLFSDITFNEKGEIIKK